MLNVEIGVSLIIARVCWEFWRALEETVSFRGIAFFHDVSQCQTWRTKRFTWRKKVVYEDPLGVYFTGKTKLPPFTTSSTLTPKLWAMKPIMVNITNPAKRLVPQLINETISVSLQNNIKNLSRGRGGTGDAETDEERKRLVQRRNYVYNLWKGWAVHLLLTVVVKFVVAAISDEPSKPNTEREENLARSLHPHLRTDQQHWTKNIW